MHDDVKPQSVVESFSVEDVTKSPDKLALAFDIVAAGYRVLASADVDCADLYNTVCFDPYHRYGLSRTLLLTGHNPDTSMLEALGTLRITLASRRALDFGLSPMEAMTLMRPPDGWDNFHFEGFDIEQIVEGGRIALSAGCRSSANKERNLPGLVLQKLVAEGFHMALRDSGKTQYWGILPTYMIRRFEAADIRVIPARQVTLRADRMQTFQQYERYWLKNDPCFCKVIVPETGK